MLDDTSYKPEQKLFFSVMLETWDMHEQSISQNDTDILVYL